LVSDVLIVGLVSAFVALVSLYVSRGKEKMLLYVSGVIVFLCLVVISFSAGYVLKGPVYVVNDTVRVVTLSNYTQEIKSCEVRHYNYTSQVNVPECKQKDYDSRLDYLDQRLSMVLLNLDIVKLECGRSITLTTQSTTTTLPVFTDAFNITGMEQEVKV
jgi:hypothetical protein